MVDCHMHMVLDGIDWRAALDRHRNGPDIPWIRKQLEIYRSLGFTYLRDGGDRFGAGRAARELAPEYGIIYRTPLSPLHHCGHYGGFIGTAYENVQEYAALVVKIREDGGDFIKVMISGLMDFDRFGRITEDPLPPEEIRELVNIAHSEGMSIMFHGNGARTVETAAAAGADSVEHGAYLDRDALEAMKENGIGRPSTRAAIIETLYKRNYIRKEKKNVLATSTGIELINLIRNELLKSAELTGQWEKKLRDIEKQQYDAKKFIDELKTMLTDIVNDVLGDNSNISNKQP